MTALAARSQAEPVVNANLESLLRGAVALGVFAVVLLPAGRGHSETLGWLPLWLVAMPLSAWWALHRFALPRWPQGADAAQMARRRGRAPQARRRRATPAASTGQRRAA